MKYTLNLKHLYPNNLNLYGDIGNVIALTRRCEWYDIDLQVENINIGDEINADTTDIYFMGGGQDSDQITVVEDWHKLKYKPVKSDLQNNVVFLGVCGGYQLMGQKFLTGNGTQIEGLGIIDLETKAPGIEVKHRCIGNLVAEIDPVIYVEMKSIYLDSDKFKIPNTLVGFENHSGQTYLMSEKVKPLAKTISGYGNNAIEKTEGARYKNIFGSYMHGSLLPKNPHFADYLIWLALTKKYDDNNIKFNRLDDKIELAAHDYIVKKTK